MRLLQVSWLSTCYFLFHIDFTVCATKKIAVTSFSALKNVSFAVKIAQATFTRSTFGAWHSKPEILSIQLAVPQNLRYSIEFSLPYGWVNFATVGFGSPYIFHQGMQPSKYTPSSLLAQGHIGIVRIPSRKHILTFVIVYCNIYFPNSIL